MSKKMQNVLTAAIVFIVLGVAMRIYAKEWATPGPASSKEEFESSLERFEQRYQLLTECGGWSVGFGLAVIATTVGAWAARD